MQEINQLVSLSSEDMKDTNGGICIFAIKNLFNNKKVTQKYGCLGNVSITVKMQKMQFK